MKPSKTILYLCVTIVPALFIGGTTLYLLRHEQERLDQRDRRVQEIQAQALARYVQESLENVVTDLLDLLGDVPESGLQAAMTELRKQNPTIRNLFLLDPDSGLVYPSPNQPASQEERAFLTRYQRLFAELDAFALRPLDTGAAEPARQSSNWVAKDNSALAREWTSWFWEDALYLIAWCRQGDGLIRGVEIETMAVFARILPELGEVIPEGSRLTITDYGGEVFFQSGEPVQIGAAIPVARTPIGRILPNWQVVAYPEAGTARTSQIFLISMSALIGLMLIAIVSGGTLLVRDARRQMREAMQKTNFVAGVSHELKTPLTSIRMYAELLGDGRVSDPEKQARYLAVMIAESRRLTRLVDNVLTFSRLEQGRKHYHSGPLDAAEIVTGVLETVRPRMDQAGVALAVTTGRGSMRVLADRDALEQVLLNLFDNALKYGCGGDQPPRVMVMVGRDDFGVTIRVRDNGPGIARKYREKIFAKFFRVDQSLTAPVTGSGLGLSIASLLVADMGGELAYEAPEDGGSCFVITLPAAAEGEDTRTGQAVVRMDHET